MLIKEAGGLVLNIFRPDLFSMIAKEGSVHPFSFFSGARHTKLFLCRAQEADFQTEKFEYEVLEADRIVGRIYFNEKSVGRKWFWEISDFAGRGKYVQKGSAELLHDAKIAVAHVLDRYRKSMAVEGREIDDSPV